MTTTLCAEQMMVPRICTTGTVVCLATGPSLTRADVDYVQGKATIIAVNDAWTLAPWAEVLYSSDACWWKFHDGVPQFSGLKFGIEVDLEGVRAIRQTGEEGIDWNTGSVRHAKNSGGAAINLAVHLGASRIVLLGYDMGATGGGHFFGRHPQELRNTKTENYKLFRERIATMVGPLAERGIQVVNCTRRTALTCFPRVPLEAVL